MHANEALNASAELKNKEVTLTSLWEPELHLWGSALKVAQRVGRSRRCHLMLHARAQTPLYCCRHPLPPLGASCLRKEKAPRENQGEL